MKAFGRSARAALLNMVGLAAAALLMASAPAPAPAPRTPPPPVLPRLVDLGAGKCIPCKKMAPIIEEMQKDYATLVDIVFVDVWKDPKAGTPYRIRLIPTQVFFDRAGQEVFRHEGFMSREDIEKVFLEKLGVTPVSPSPKGPKAAAGGGAPPRQHARG